jgi:hypothetical protein
LAAAELIGVRLFGQHGCPPLPLFVWKQSFRTTASL